jgi:hypothetical protein
VSLLSKNIKFTMFIADPGQKKFYRGFEGNLPVSAMKYMIPSSRIIRASLMRLLEKSESVGEGGSETPLTRRDCCWNTGDCLTSMRRRLASSRLNASGALDQGMALIARAVPGHFQVFSSGGPGVKEGIFQPTAGSAGV